MLRRSDEPFLQKMYEILSLNSNIVGWNEAGTSFRVSNIDAFANTIIPRYFAHNNFSSFVRQLNIYGFYKVKYYPTQQNSSDKNEAEFCHPLFQRDHPDLINQIQRKQFKSIKSKSSTEINETLLNFNQRIDSLERTVHLLTQAIQSLEKKRTNIEMKLELNQSSNIGSVTNNEEDNKIKLLKYESNSTQFQSNLESNTFLTNHQMTKLPEENTILCSSNKNDKEIQIFQYPQLQSLDEYLTSNQFENQTIDTNTTSSIMISQPLTTSVITTEAEKWLNDISNNIEDL